MIEAVINFFREMAPAGPEIEWEQQYHALEPFFHIWLDGIR